MHTCFIRVDALVQFVIAIIGLCVCCHIFHTTSVFVYLVHHRSLRLIGHGTLYDTKYHDTFANLYHKCSHVKCVNTICALTTTNNSVIFRAV